MTRRRFQFVFGAFLARAATAGWRQTGFAVIVHPSNRFDSLNRTRLKYLFLRKVSRWPWGAQVEPVDLAVGNPARLEFLRQVLETTEEEFGVYWIDQRAVHGINPPATAKTAAAVKTLVASRPGAIAYIPTAELDDTVKAIRVEP
jgi:hypothetical protein